MNVASLLPSRNQKVQRGRPFACRPASGCSMDGTGAPGVAVPGSLLSLTILVTCLAGWEGLLDLRLRPAFKTQPPPHLGTPSQEPGTWLDVQLSPGRRSAGPAEEEGLACPAGWGLARQWSPRRPPWTPGRNRPPRSAQRPGPQRSRATCASEPRLEVVSHADALGWQCPGHSRL